MSHWDTKARAKDPPRLRAGMALQSVGILGDKSTDESCDGDEQLRGQCGTGLITQTAYLSLCRGGACVHAPIHSTVGMDTDMSVSPQGVHSLTSFPNQSLLGTAVGPDVLRNGTKGTDMIHLSAVGSPQELASMW